MDDDSWNQMLKKRKEKAPAWIELIRNSEVDALGLRGVRNLIGSNFNVKYLQKHPLEYSSYVFKLCVCAHCSSFFGIYLLL